MDDRFKVMFENPDYQVDERSEEYRLLNPIVSKVGEKRRKKLSQLVQQEEQVHNSITSIQHFLQLCSKPQDFFNVSQNLIEKIGVVMLPNNI